MNVNCPWNLVLANADEAVSYSVKQWTGVH